jgi:hypothetical protein
MRPVDLARELGVSPKTVRQWLRDRYGRKAEEKYQRWDLTALQERAVRSRFESRRKRADSREHMLVTSVAFPAKQHAQLVRAAREGHTVMTQIVRLAVTEWLERRKHNDT